MREGQWLQIMLDQKTLKFEFHGTFTLQYSAEVLWNKTTPDLQGKEPLPYKHASKLRPIAKHSLRPYTKKKLTQNEYLICGRQKLFLVQRNVLSN